MYIFHVYIQKCILNVFWTVHSCVHLYLWADHILPIVSYVNWMCDTFLHAYRWIDLEQYSNTTISHIIVCPITLFTVKTYPCIFTITLINMIMKESLNSDGHQFHQYQQNKQSPLIITELTENKTDHSMTLEIEVLVPTQKCGGVKPLMESQP